MKFILFIILSSQLFCSVSPYDKLSGMIYKSGVFFESIYTKVERDDDKQTKYGMNVGYFITPNIELNAALSFIEERVVQNENSYDADSNEFSFGLNYHIETFNIGANTLNFKLGAEYKIFTFDQHPYEDRLSIDSFNGNFFNLGIYFPFLIDKTKFVPFFNPTIGAFTIKGKLEQYDGSITNEESKGLNASFPLGIGVSKDRYAIVSGIYLEPNFPLFFSVSMKIK